MPSDQNTTRLHILYADPDENALVVEYSGHTTDRRTKKIVLGNLNDLNDVDVASLAKKVVRKCDCIPEECVEDVEDVIVEIRDRASNDGVISVTSEHFDQFVDEALELLYDSSHDKKLKGTIKVLSLCRDSRILEDIVQNHQLMSALSRLLGESDSLPIDLTFGIGKLFLTLSLIEDFHEALSSHRVGALALGVAELELKRVWHRG